MKRYYIPACYGCLLLLSLNSMAQSQYEPPPVLKASKILSSELLSGTHHRVQQNVANDGYMNSYTISSNIGTFKASSSAQLRKRIIEINAIAKMNAIKGTKTYKESLMEAGGDVVTGMKSLVTSPIDTVSGAVSGVGKAFRRAGESLFGSARSDAEESRIKDVIGFAKTKREYADDFGVDVYSANQVLQEHLNDMAWAGYAGGMTVAAVMTKVPGKAKTVSQISGGSRIMNEVLRNTPPTELRPMNRKKLKQMGIHQNIIDLFIDNTAYSPRDQTLLVNALEGMVETAYRAALIKYAVRTSERDLAFFRQRMSRMYAGYHHKIASIKQFVTVGDFVAALSRQGKFVVAAPVDHLVWTSFTHRVIDAFSRRAKFLGTKGKELWITGSISKLTRQSLEQQGWEIHEHSGSILLADFQD